MNEERLWHVLDEIREDVKDLCTRAAIVETQLNDHLKHQETKFNKTTMVLGIVVAIVAVVAAIK